MKATVFAKIEAQQPKERNAVWMVGEQLKDIIQGDPRAQEIVLQDLDVKEMSLAECEKKIAERAKKNKVGSVGCVTPAEAEEIIREFYGIGAAVTEEKPSSTAPLSLASFFG